MEDNSKNGYIELIGGVTLTVWNRLLITTPYLDFFHAENAKARYFT
jgi:hypothetical protein